jgi:hypothetical protein
MNTGIPYILTNITAGPPPQAVWKQIIDMETLVKMLSELGGGDMMKQEFATNGATGVVDRAVAANQLHTARNITMTGDATGSANTNFSGDVGISLTLAEVLTGGAGAGVYRITLDNKGRVTAAVPVVASDLPNLPHTQITGLGTAATRDVGKNPGNVVMVETNGKIDGSLMPSISIVDVREFNTEAEMLQWANDPVNPAEQGDIAIVNLATGALVYIARNGDLTQIGNWTQLNIPTGAILQINGHSGAVINLTTTDIPEGSNLYYTDARAGAEADRRIAADTTLLRNTDTLILDGGNADLTA